MFCEKTLLTSYKAARACLYAEHIENDNRIKKARGCRALCAMCADQTGPAQSAQASNSPFTDALQRVLPPSFSSPLAFLLFHLLCFCHIPCWRVQPVPVLGFYSFTENSPLFSPFTFTFSITFHMHPEIMTHFENICNGEI